MGPRELLLQPSFPGKPDQDPHLGKRTTCLWGFIRFQGEATGFTLKITEDANSFSMQMVFVSVGQII